MAVNPVYTTLLSSKAQKEIAAAWQWYEERQQGLGDHFVKEVIGRLQGIEKNPDRFPTRYKTYKEAPVPVFPYLIIYRVNKRKHSVRVVSVFHTSLNPGKKP